MSLNSWQWLAPVIGLAGVLALAAVPAPQQKTTAPPGKGTVEPAPQSGVATPQELLKVYRTNAALAIERYHEKRIRVRGAVIRIRGGEKVWAPDEQGKLTRLRYMYVLEMATGEAADKSCLSFAITASFDGPDHKALARVEPGQMVTMEALCKGWLPERNRTDDREWIYFWDAVLVEP